VGGERTLPGPRSDLEGRVVLPPSKSITNRALIMSAVAGGGRVDSPLSCEDTRLLAQALRECGWGVQWNDGIVVEARNPASKPLVKLHLGNSGTGSRLLLALLAATPGVFVVDGTRRLRQRPFKPLLDALTSLGCRLEMRDNCLPVQVEGGVIHGGSVRMRPGTSSQYVTALLLVAPLMTNGLELELEGVIPSRPYLDLTADMLHQFGARLHRDSTGRKWRVEPGLSRPSAVRVEADWSAAAFFFAAVAVAGGEVVFPGLLLQSAQGDARICRILRDAGLRVDSADGQLTVSGPIASPINADLSDTPDMFPALSVVAASAPAGSCLTGLGNLKHKESDRLAVMVENLQRLGAAFDVSENRLLVKRSLGRDIHRQTRVTAADDHRIAMSMAVAALVAGPLILDDPECVGKSFPDFWSTWQRLCP